MSSVRTTNLTWQEMICLHEQGLGLRSVPGGVKQALDEQKNGGCGDAVPLATFGYPDAKDLKLSEHPYIAGNLSTAYSWLTNEETMDKYYSHDKATLLARFHGGIYNHVRTSVQVFDNRSFVLVKMNNAAHPYCTDILTLGKCGRQSFEANQVKAVINPPADNLGWDTDTAFNAVIAEIKAFCHVKILEKQPSTPTLSQVSAKQDAPQTLEIHSVIGPSKAPNAVLFTSNNRLTFNCPSFKTPILKLAFKII